MVPHCQRTSLPLANLEDRVGVRLMDIQATVTGASKGMGRSNRWITEEENRNQERGKRQFRGREEGPSLPL